MLQHDQDSTYPRFAEAYVASVTPLSGLEQFVRCTEGADYKQISWHHPNVMCWKHVWSKHVCNAVIWTSLRETVTRHWTINRILFFKGSKVTSCFFNCSCGLQKRKKPAYYFSHWAKLNIVQGVHLFVGWFDCRTTTERISTTLGWRMSLRIDPVPLTCVADPDALWNCFCIALILMQRVLRCLVWWFHLQGFVTALVILNYV